MYRNSKLMRTGCMPAVSYITKSLPVMVLLAFILSVVFLAAGAEAVTPEPVQDDYVVIGWNDLGMHCINPSYSQIALLPPFNNLWAQVIKRGDPPTIVTSDITLEYSFPNNTTVNGKSDFWKYGAKLYANLLGVPVPKWGIGLTGNGLSGTMKLAGDHFEASGLPALPYDDGIKWNPYQIVRITLKDRVGKELKSTRVVVPVSDEIHCDMCHMQGGDGTINLPVDPTTGMTGTMDVNLNILMTHDYYNGQNGATSKGTNLVGTQPVLCAKCHSDNALGAPGVANVKSLSLAMHGWHNGVQRAPDATCYSCHPGEKTKCLRTAIGGMGYMGKTPACQTGQCHGGIAGMGNPDRTPWVTEPTCKQCHGKNYSTGKELYRNSKGHGGVYCAACHNSPHTWWPSKKSSDNIQPVRLQYEATSMGGACEICHTNWLRGDNPHVNYLPYP
jgi:hypothetical protein